MANVPPRRRIQVLPDPLIDQIAAGEVVERPASVVKELVENAIDAEARRLRIELRDGGAALVAVTDDGWGMAPEEARLALERHATSKIQAAEDLQQIATYGFRGEALPSIAAVSRLRLRTRARGAPEGFEIRAEAGRIGPGRAAAGPEGTRIEVADLFASVPARRKFLKTAATEWTHIADWLGRIAIAHPEIHFDVARDDRPATTWPVVEDPIERIAAVLSERDAAALVPVDLARGPFALRGFVSRPDHHRPNAAAVSLFVNRRPVRDRLLRHALVQAYRDALPRGRFPAAVLFLECPPDAVDVNVHPAKWEVRFADPTAIHRLVAEAVRTAFAERRWIGGGGGRPGEDTGSRERPGALARDGAGGRPGLPARPPGEAPVSSAGPLDWVLAGEGSPAGTDGASLVGEAEPGAALRYAELRLLGQTMATYLVLEGPEGLVLVDQHAAHERVLYEGLRKRWREGKVERQALLVPETVDLPAAAVGRLAEAREEIEALGFEIELFGEQSVAVRALPAILAGRDPAALVRTLGDELSGPGPGRSASGRLAEAERIFASLACHAARRMGDRLEPAEQRALLTSLDSIPWAPTCPHGRPVAVSLPRAEIERRFGRR